MQSERNAADAMNDNGDQGQQGFVYSKKVMSENNPSHKKQKSSTAAAAGANARQPQANFSATKLNVAGSSLKKNSSNDMGLQNVHNKEQQRLIGSEMSSDRSNRQDPTEGGDDIKMTSDEKRQDIVTS